MKNKITLKKLIITIIILIFIVLFAANLFTRNKAYDISKDEVVGNISVVNKHDFSTVKKVESSIAALEESERRQGLSNNGSTALKNTYYKQMFANSVILGDSVTEGLTVYRFLNSSQVYCKIGGSLLNSGDYFTTAAKTYPKYAFFAFGMNDMISYRGDPTGFIKKYKSLLANFHKISPDTKMYICTVTKPMDSVIKRRPVLGNWAKFNKAINGMCSNTEYLNYLDTTDIFINNPSLYEADGIHAKAAYYPYWLNRMISVSGMK